MKWKDLHLSMSFMDEDVSVEGFLNNLEDGRPFPCQLVIDWCDEGEVDEKPLFAERVINLILLSLEVHPMGRLKVVVKMRNEELPEGIKQGIYTLWYRSGLSEGLPTEMFEDSDVPDDMIPDGRGNELPRCPRCFRKSKRAGKECIFMSEVKTLVETFACAACGSISEDFEDLVFYIDTLGQKVVLGYIMNDNY